MSALPLEPPRRRPENPEHPFAGFLNYQGIMVDVETAAGTYREGIDPDGHPWRVKLPCHYGEVRGTTGSDGDPVDVFVGPERFAPLVYVVQAKAPRSKTYDETKAGIGYRTRADAVAAFRAMYTAPGFLLGVTTWPIGAWREAMARPHIHRGPMDKPLTKAVVNVVRIQTLAKGFVDRRGDSVVLPSAFAIGDPVVVSMENPAGTPVVDPSAGMLFGHVRAVIFAAGTVRYSILVGNLATTLHNVDSSFVRPWPGGLRMVFDFDNYS